MSGEVQEWYRDNCLTSTWDVFKLKKRDGNMKGRRSLTSTWDVFK